MTESTSDAYENLRKGPFLMSNDPVQRGFPPISATTKSRHTQNDLS